MIEYAHSYNNNCNTYDSKFDALVGVIMDKTNLILLRPQPEVVYKVFCIESGPLCTGHNGPHFFIRYH